MAVRDGRVHVGALAAVGNRGRAGAGRRSAGRSRRGATAAFDAAIAALADSFPESPALLAAKARKAGFLVRGGDTAGGRALFDEVVDEGANVADSVDRAARLARALFRLAGARRDRPTPRRRCSARAQLLQRPGVAQTQAILARQYSAGNDEGSALFRLAVARTREIVRAGGRDQAARGARPSGRRPRTQTLAAGKVEPRGAARRAGPAAGAAQRLSALQGAGPQTRSSSPSCRRRFARARAITR